MSQWFIFESCWTAASWLGSEAPSFMSYLSLSQNSHRFGPLGIQKGVVNEMIQSDSGIPLATQQKDPLHRWNKFPTDNVMGNTRALPFGWC